MSHNEQVLQKTIIQQIKDSRWSVKGYFQDLFAQLLPAELLQNDRLSVIDELIADTLPEVLSKQYDKDGYVLMFYAHKTHSNFISPHNHDTNASHTSLLLCKVDNGKINQVLNIDGYHNLPYMDIIGERPNAKPNPYIKNRLVIDAPENPNFSERKPLQSASWNNLNCPLYAFAFAKAILNAFTISPEVLDDLFVGNTISREALPALKDMILQGVEGTYVKNDHGSLCRDTNAGIAFHASVRKTLAETVQARFDQHQVDKEAVQQTGVAENKQPVSVSSSSMFKPVGNDAAKAIKKLMGHCIAYQTHLNAELQKLTGQTLDEVEQLVKKHVVNTTEPNDLDKIIKKYRIANSMVDALHNPEEADEKKLISNMNLVLTQENRAVLAEHRSGGGKFLQAVLNVLSAIFSVFSKQEWKYKTEGDELIDNIIETSTP